MCGVQPQVPTATCTLARCSPIHAWGALADMQGGRLQCLQQVGLPSNKSGWRAGLDIDREALLWGLRHNGEGLVGGHAPRLCLLQCDVRDAVESAQPVALPADTCGTESGTGQAADALSALQLEGDKEPCLHAEGASLGGHEATDSTPAASGASSSSRPEQQGHARQCNGHAAEPNGSSREGDCAAPMQQQHGPGLDAADDSAAEEADLRSKPADIICAFNFSVCLLHERTEVQVHTPLPPPLAPLSIYSSPSVS
jgi:hypothetical protein